MISKLHRYLMRFSLLRNSQWFYKSVPRSFVKVEQGGAECAACGSPATHRSEYPSRVKPFADSTVSYCTSCGLGFVLNMRNTIVKFYEEDYAETNRQDRDLPPEDYFAQFDSAIETSFQKYARRGKRQIELLKKFGAAIERVMDYGSGPGYFLWLAEVKGGHAVEPDNLSHKYLDSLGAQIHFDHKSLPKDSFDTIVASHAIEHLPAEDLQEVLKALLGALQPGGRMLIEVPQGGHSHLNLAGQRQDPHTLFFTGRALVEAIGRAGGEIVFQQAMGRVESPRRANPIYTPSGPPFFTTARGSLTVICTKS